MLASKRAPLAIIIVVTESWLWLGAVRIWIWIWIETSAETLERFWDLYLPLICFVVDISSREPVENNLSCHFLTKVFQHFQVQGCTLKGWYTKIGYESEVLSMLRGL